MQFDIFSWIRSSFGTPPVSALFILFVSLMLAIIYFVVQVVVTDIDKLKRYNARIKKWQQKYKNAMKSGNPRLISEVQKEKEIIDKLRLEVASESFKPMMITFLLFFVVYYIIIGAYGLSTVLALPFKLPIEWLGPLYLGPSNYIEYKGEFISGISAFAWYILTSIVISSIINALLKLLGYRPS